MPIVEHLHTYRRVGKSATFCCYHPICTHFTKKEFLIGKKAMCRCGNPFILDYRALQLKVPHCLECLKPYKENSRQAIEKRKALNIKVNEVLEEAFPATQNNEPVEQDSPVENNEPTNEPRKRIGYEI